MLHWVYIYAWLWWREEREKEKTEEGHSLRVETESRGVHEGCSEEYRICPKGLWYRIVMDYKIYIYRCVMKVQTSCENE